MIYTFKRIVRARKEGIRLGFGLGVAVGFIAAYLLAGVMTAFLL